MVDTERHELRRDARAVADSLAQVVRVGQGEGRRREAVDLSETVDEERREAKGQIIGHGVVADERQRGGTETIRLPVAVVFVGGREAFGHNARGGEGERSVVGACADTDGADDGLVAAGLHRCRDLCPRRIGGAVCADIDDTRDGLGPEDGALAAAQDLDPRCRSAGQRAEIEAGLRGGGVAYVDPVEQDRDVIAAETTDAQGRAGAGRAILAEADAGPRGERVRELKIAGKAQVFACQHIDGDAGARPPERVSGRRKDDVVENEGVLRHDRR
jgi:hypothetical protein